MQSQLKAREQNEGRLQQMALPQEQKVQGNADVGGSQTDPNAEDVELEVFSTTSIYCIKYMLWRRLQVQI